MWHIYTTEYYSAIKKSEIMPFAATWMDFDLVVLSEVSQTQKDKYHVTNMWNLKKEGGKMNFLQNRSRVTDVEHKLTVIRA